MIRAMDEKKISPEEKKISREELSQWLLANQKKAVWLAQTLQVTPATVSRWINGKNPIAGSDEALLRLLIRGEMPFEIVSEKLVHSVMEFTPREWKVIVLIATKAGVTPGKWIAQQIRSYLAFTGEAREIDRHLNEQEADQTPRFRIEPPPEQGEDSAEGTGA